MEHLVGDDAVMRKAILKSDNYEPCEEDYATSYMNLPEVISIESIGLSSVMMYVCPLVCRSARLFT